MIELKIYICPNCNNRNYAFRKLSICTRCGKQFDRDNCEYLVVEKEPFINCPFCDTKYDNPVVSCNKCGFSYQSIDDAEKLEKRFQNESNNICIPKCPTCGSTNIEKISFAKKAISIGGLGILSNKIGKQWHCNNCKSDF